jgi:hypothetical protein
MLVILSNASVYSEKDINFYYGYPTERAAENFFRFCKSDAPKTFASGATRRKTAG